MHLLFKYTLIAAALAVFSSCNQNPVNPLVPAANAALLYEMPLAQERIMGTYTGEFKGAPIAVTIRYVSGRRVSGYNVYNGLKRNVTGTVSLSGTQLQLHLSEPGTNPYDGKFDLYIDTATWRGRGVWNPLKEGKEVSFTLKKEKEEGGINSIAGVYLDSLSNTIELKADGSCIYSYLVNDSTATAQQLKVAGNYKFSRDSSVSVHWQSNEVFPSRKSVFRLYSKYEEDEYSYKSLVGEGKEFSELIY